MYIIHLYCNLFLLDSLHCRVCIQCTCINISLLFHLLFLVIPSRIFYCKIFIFIIIYSLFKLNTGNIILNLIFKFNFLKNNIALILYSQVHEIPKYQKLPQGDKHMNYQIININPSAAIIIIVITAPRTNSPTKPQPDPHLSLLSPSPYKHKP